MIESKQITAESDLNALEAAMQFEGSIQDETSEKYEFMVFRRLWAINQSIIIAIREQARRPLQAQYCGYAACIPLKNEFLLNLVPELKKSRQSIRAHLKPESILTENEALDKTNSDGNALFVSVTAKENRKPEFATISAQLFFKLEERIKELRVRLVLAEALRPEYKEIGISTGFRILYKTNSGTDVFYFDIGLLTKHHSFGTMLGDIMLHLWGMPNMTSLNLSKTRRMIARLLVEGITEKCLADELKSRYVVQMSTWTAMDHVKQIRNRFRQVFPEKTGTKDLICYLADNRFEIFEPKELSELILLSTLERLETTPHSSSPTEAKERLL